MSLESGQGVVFTWRRGRWRFSLMGVVKRQVCSFGRHPCLYLLLLRQTLGVACGRLHLLFFLISRTLNSLKWPLAQLKIYISQHWQLVLANEL